MPRWRFLFQKLLVLRFRSLGFRGRIVDGLLLDPIELGLLLRFDPGEPGCFGVLLGLFDVALGLLLRSLRLALLLDLRVAAVDFFLPGAVDAGGFGGPFVLLARLLRARRCSRVVPEPARC